MNVEPFSFLAELGEWSSFKPGLSRVRHVLTHLGSPHERFPHYLVGGTNGKGTVSYNLARLLPGRMGLFISPHLIDIRERITVNGRWCSDAQWRETFFRVRARVPDAEMSYFEWLLVLACMMFAENKVDAAVFEVGLGGRLDATNVLNPACSIVTNVSLDHCELLGPDIETIALEKIEIARAGKPFLCPQTILQYSSISKRLKEIQCEIHPFSGGEDYESNRDILQAAAKLLPLAPLNGGLCHLPGRRERCDVGRGIILDGAHNPAAWRDLAAWIGPTEQPYHLLLALSGKRNPEVLLDIMAGIHGMPHIYGGNHEKFIPRQCWPGHIPLVREEDFPQLLERPLLVCGSLYLVGLFKQWLRTAEFVCNS